MKLLIVESPSKAKTIEKYLGGAYTVRSSVGHVRDLPTSNKKAIDIEAGFVPHYEISKGKEHVIHELERLAQKSEEILLATDPDREGEAISWHLAELLHKNKKVNAPVKRVTFNEITKDAILEALKQPRSIDQNLVKAQEARRVLDRLVGYDLSGIIWKKVRYGLSAGRVQSPALRILMEREREIKAFIPEVYFVLKGHFETKSEDSLILTCSEEPKTQEEADAIAKKAREGSWTITDVKTTEVKRSPKAPFTTSTLQQAASSRLGFSPKRTMQVAQKLYEAGHITYMRTDSTNLSKQAVEQILSLVEKEYGKKYAEARTYATKVKNAQEAHEAVRPTHIASKSAGANDEQVRLYQLIWERTVASQMADAKLMRTKITANIADRSLPDFSDTGSQVIFDGWLRADKDAKGEDVFFPSVSKDDPLTLKDFETTEKQTEPPSRYTEAALVKALEERGIGRPSTYASIMSTLEERGYVTKQGRTLFPTDTGEVVSGFLENHFSSYISDTFTADMEQELDDIASGKRDYAKTLADFYTPFQKEIREKEKLDKATSLGEADSNIQCPKCGSGMIVKLGRGGKFLSCSRYPDCDGALTLEGLEIKGDTPIGYHPETNEPIFVKSGRFGPYVQLGLTPEKKPKKKVSRKKTAAAEGSGESKKGESIESDITSEIPKPRMASIPKEIPVDQITIDQALHLLALPRTLGTYPKTGESIIANIGRFGPYIGAGAEFRSLKKPFDPYTIELADAITLLDTPKALPKGATKSKELGIHPKTKKKVTAYLDKKGIFVKKGLRRIYLEAKDLDNLTLETAISQMM